MGILQYRGAIRVLTTVFEMENGQGSIIRRLHGCCCAGESDVVQLLISS